MPSSSLPSPVRRTFRVVVAGSMLAPVLAMSVGSQSSDASAKPAPVARTAGSATSDRVTLVTGDVVTVQTLAGGEQVADVDRPNGAFGGVRVQEVANDIYVIPDEAVGLLGADRLDPRLFNVTDLIEMGYDDANYGQVPMIATYEPPKTRGVVKTPVPPGSTLVRRLPSIGGAALTTSKRRTDTFWASVIPRGGLAGRDPSLRSGIEKLWLDGQVQADLDESVAQIGAPTAWAAGYNGAGVTVAVLDTGVDASHPDLATQVDATASFVPGETVTDINGHGTHVASTIAGTGAASSGTYKGVAPGADLLVGKVLGGTDGFGQDSWVIAGMQWAAESGADVVNMSLGDTAPSDGTDPMAQTVDALSQQYGTLFVVASGNAGPESISTPGAAGAALTVGAVDGLDSLAFFSSTGPLAHTGALKPDIVAPGVDITAARSQQTAGGGEGYYQTMSGTSMATPHVAGAAAIVAQQHPAWTGNQIKEQLMSSAKNLGEVYSPYDVGTGRVDVAAAVQNTVRGTGSLFFGNYLWPHGPEDVAVSKDLTFTNAGAVDVTLDLALTGGSNAFSLGASSVTVPAGGKETVSITGDPGAVDPGRHVGYIVGTDSSTGQPVTRTSVGLLKEDERYDLNIKLIDRAGAPAEGYVTVALAGDTFPLSLRVDGESTLRMPPGTYSVVTSLDVTGEKPGRSGMAVMVDPEIVLDHSANVVLDARDARLLETKAPQRTEDRQRKVDLSIVDSAGTEFRSAYEVPPTYDDIYVSPTEPVADGSFMLTTRWRKVEPALAVSPQGGGRPFATIVQAGSVLKTRTDTWAAVYAGNGGPADYEDLNAQGKVVVIKRSDQVGPVERTDAAVQAGARALLVVNDGIGGLTEYVGESAIPVATVHRHAGKALIALAEGTGKLTLTQVAYPRYLYDLTRDYPGQVPDRRLLYAPSKQDLAKIDSRYYGVRPGEGSGYRYDLTLSPALGFHEREWHPGTRVEWVTPKQVWVESHAQNIQGNLPWEVVSGVNTYRAGTTTRDDWFRPAIRPAFSDAFAVQNSRWQDYMTFNVQQWSSSSDTMRLGGYLPWGATPGTVRLFQGDTLIDQGPGGDFQFQQVPPGNLPYRVVVDAQRPGKIFALSTKTHTEWTFRSDTQDSENFVPFSVMQLDYRMETNLRGDVKAGARKAVAVRSISSDGGPLPGQVTEVTLQLSHDNGHSWTAVDLHRRHGGWWGGSFDAPKRAGAYISVRATAQMSSGYSIKQKVIRAYGVR